MERAAGAAVQRQKIQLRFYLVEVFQRRFDDAS
jgi:hypothetical protein